MRPAPEAVYVDVELTRIFRDFKAMWPPVQTALRFIGATRLIENPELVSACKAWNWCWAARACWHPNLDQDENEHAEELFYEAASAEGRDPRTGQVVLGGCQR